ncbi:MAG: histidine kinase [Clostridia bacterium]
MKRYRLISEAQFELLVKERIAQATQTQHADAERDRLRRQMDMAVLQAQINPHFLYNTLECIRGQALAAGAADIADTTQALSRFFRYSISIRDDVVPLKSELDNVRNYMKIQQYRFQDRFQLGIHYDQESPEVLDGLLPKLTLQPIVENAVVHGLSRKTQAARIDIDIIQTQKHLNIQVSDNGRGMNQATLKNLSDMLNGQKHTRDDASPGNGIAMENVMKRIQLFFGAEYGLTISSIEGVGTDVDIHIPYRT